MDHTTPLILNIDAQQIAHFDALATDWWEPQGDLKTLHAINPLRLEYILQYSHGLFGKQVLDVGCGGGILSESMALEGAMVTGIDKSAELLQVASAHASEQRLSIQYLNQSAESYADNRPHYYDVVTCMELLEHVPDPAAVVQACSRLVKPQGYVFFSTLNRTFKAWLLAIVAAERLLHLIPQGTHHIQKFIRPSELCHWLATTSLQECHIIGLHYHPLWRRFNFTTNVNINYLLVAQHQG